MAESIVPLRKKIKDSLTRQGMRNIRGLHRKGLAEVLNGSSTSCGSSPLVFNLDLVVLFSISCDFTR